MKFTVIGSHLCPDTLYALNRLSEAGAEIDFKNLSASLSDLKAYLALRQDSPVYADIRENGGIGIPCSFWRTAPSPGICNPSFPGKKFHRSTVQARLEGGLAFSPERFIMVVV